MIYHFNTLPVHPKPKKIQSQSDYIELLMRENLFTTKIAIRLMIAPDNERDFHRNPDLPLQNNQAMQTTSVCTDSKLKQLTYYHLAAKFDRGSNIPSISKFISNSLSQDARLSVKRVDRDGYRILTERMLMLSVCPEFGTPLVDHCPSCDRKIPIFMLRKAVLVCTNCGTDFRQHQSIMTPLPNVDIDKARQIHDDLEYFLLPSEFEQDAPNLLISLGSHLAFERWKQDLQIKTVSEITGLSQNCISGMENGKVRGKNITFMSYWRYANFFNLRLRALYDRILKYRQDGILSAYMDKKRLREDYLLILVKEATMHLYHNGDTLSIKSIARYTGYSTLTLYPRVYKYLQNDLQALRQQQIWEYEAKLLQQVKDTHLLLVENGQRVSQNAISTQIGISTKGLRSYASVATYLDRVVDIYKNMHHKREEELYQAVLVAAKQLRQEGEDVTQVAIGNIIEISPEGLKHYPLVRSLLMQITNSHQSDRNEKNLLVKTRNAINELSDASKPITPKAIADLLGQSISSMRAYPKVREELDVIHKEHLEAFRSNLIDQVHDAIQTLQKSGKEVTQKKVAEIVGFHTDSLRYYSEIADLFKDIIEVQKFIQEEINASRYNQVVDAVGQLRKQGEEINKRNIVKITGISINALYCVKAIKKFLNRVEEQREMKQEQYEKHVTSTMADTIEKMRSEGTPITQDLVSQYMKIPLFKLRQYSLCRQMLEEIAIESRRNNINHYKVGHKKRSE